MIPQFKPDDSIPTLTQRTLVVTNMDEYNQLFNQQDLQGDVTTTLENVDDEF